MNFFNVEFWSCLKIGMLLDVVKIGVFIKVDKIIIVSIVVFCFDIVVVGNFCCGVGLCFFGYNVCFIEIY